MTVADGIDPNAAASGVADTTQAEETPTSAPVVLVDKSVINTDTVKAGEDFTVEMTYTAPDGTSMSKSLTVVIDDTATAAAALPQGNSTSAYASTSAPPPPFTTGKITKIEYVVSTWLIWFNGVEAYCCSHGLNGQPNGCPTYNFAYVSKLEPGQYTPGNHYANQINIWGGLNQLSLGVLTEKHDSTTFSGSEFAANLPSFILLPD